MERKSPRCAFLKISANAHLAHPAFPSHKADTQKREEPNFSIAATKRTVGYHDIKRFNPKYAMALATCIFDKEIQSFTAWYAALKK